MVRNPDIIIKLATDYTITITEFDMLSRELYILLKEYPFIKDVEIIWPEKYGSIVKPGVMFKLESGSYKVVERMSEEYWSCLSIDSDKKLAVLERDIIRAIMLEAWSHGRS